MNSVAVNNLFRINISYMSSIIKPQRECFFVYAKTKEDAENYAKKKISTHLKNQGIGQIKFNIGASKASDGELAFYEKNRGKYDGTLN